MHFPDWEKVTVSYPSEKQTQKKQPTPLGILGWFLFSWEITGKRMWKGLKSERPPG